ncbi:hypothetical protein ACK6D9_04800 [Hoeflea sp. Naph1]|jgi:hypothetical protein|uniref:hypothetical protein n=1 Tax=Hoeflea sp. Naph1 TaxID=3388653 RepID=UPI00398FEC6C
MGLRWTENRQAIVQRDLPEPEEVFICWLMEQPPQGSLLAAASREAARLARYNGSHEGPRKLARMFAELIEQLEKPRQYTVGNRSLSDRSPSGQEQLP